MVRGETGGGAGCRYQTPLSNLCLDGKGEGPKIRQPSESLMRSEEEEDEEKDVGNQRLLFLFGLPHTSCTARLQAGRLNWVKTQDIIKNPTDFPRSLLNVQFQESTAV